MKDLLLSSRDLERCEKAIEESIAKAVLDSCSDGVVLGLSGGIDSALVLKLAHNSGVDIHAMLMPEEGMTKECDLKEAMDLCKSLKIEYSVVKINPVIDVIYKTFPWKDFAAERKKTAYGNAKARVRMIYNYLASNLDNRIVLGTGNRTEILLGYATKYGDAGVDIQPIGDLYKTQVRQLALYAGIPKKILEKCPTAGLWKGQTDEGELGAKYEEMDRILYCLVDEGLTIKETAKRTGEEQGLVERLANRMEKNRHKRLAAPVTGLFD